LREELRHLGRTERAVVNPELVDLSEQVRIARVLRRPEPVLRGLTRVTLLL